MQTFFVISAKNPSGYSWTTYWTRNRVFRYSTSLFIKATKCSPFLILPGTASCRTWSGRTGFARTTALSLFSWAWRKPATSLSYSSFRRSLSADLSLCISYSKTVIEFWHLSKSLRLILTLIESIHVLSILWASSKTTTEFLANSFETTSAIFGSNR